MSTMVCTNSVPSTATSTSPTKPTTKPIESLLPGVVGGGMRVAMANESDEHHRADDGEDHRDREEREVDELVDTEPVDRGVQGKAVALLGERGGERATGERNGDRGCEAARLHRSSFPGADRADHHDGDEVRRGDHRADEERCVRALVARAGGARLREGRGDADGDGERGPLIARPSRRTRR